MSTINTKTINRDGNTNVLDGYVQVWNSSTQTYEAKYPSTVSDASVTLAKIQNITTDSLIGRDTAGTGSSEVITLNSTLEMTGAQVLQRAAISGDITVAAGSNTAAITTGVIVNADINASAAISYSKLLLGNFITNSDIFTSAQIAHSKLATITTDSLLGRDSASTGTLETITLGASLSMTGAQVLQRAALTGDVTATAGSNSCTVTDLTITSEQQGSILYFNGTNWVQLAPSTDGYVLTTHSTSQNPTWTNVNTNILSTTNTSTTAITFSTNKRYIWTGSGATSLTFSATGAVDGTSISIFFQANQISSLTVDTNLSPAANYAVANFVATAPYILVMTYLASGPTVITYGYPTTDL